MAEMDENCRTSEHKEIKNGADNGVQTSTENNAAYNGDDKRTQRKRYRFKNRRKKKLSFDALSECRKMFRQEMIVLAKEVEQFRIVCDAQIDKYQKRVREEKDNYEKVTNNKESKNGRIVGADEIDEIWRTQLNNLQSDMEYLERKQLLLDKEQKLISKEDDLSRKQKDLEEYEQEIEEVEHMLDKRQALCDKRLRDIDDLDEDLRSLRHDMLDEKAGLEIKEKGSERAKNNWEILRNKMLDKQINLESTVQRYKTDLATVNSTIAAKDLAICKLSAEIKTIKEELKEKEKKIHQLESRLTLTIDEARNLEIKLRTNKLDNENSIHPKLSPKSSLESLDGSFSRQRGSFKKQLPLHITNSPRNGKNIHRQDSFNSGNVTRTSGKISQKQSYSRTDSNMSSASSGGTSSACNLM